MNTSESIRRLAIVNLLIGILFIAVWTLVTFSKSKQAYKSTPSDVSASYHHEPTNYNKLPRLSVDKKTLVVTSEDALPTAFEFLRLNMYLPIKKIVLMKPGVNETVRVYPIPREGMIALNGNDMSLSASEIGMIGLIVLFLIFIIGSFAYIFTSIGNARIYWDEEGWLNNDDFCFDVNVNDLSLEDETGTDEKLLAKAEKKRREIEGEK